MLSEQTEQRLQVVSNGYTPLPNVDKLCQLPGWSSVEVTENTIRQWGRMRAYEATGLRLDNGLAALDFDVNVPEVEELYESLLDAFPELNEALYRRGRGYKEAWFVRTAEPFGRIATATYEGARGEGLTVEIFGGESPRQFGALGWHTKDELEYSWIDGDPTTVPLSELPELPVERFMEIARACYLWLDARFERVRGEDVERTSARDAWDIPEDAVFQTREDGELDLESLRERLGRGGYYYLSASWVDGPVARNTRRCSATIDHAGGVAIWDSMTDITHHEIGLQPATMETVAEQRAGVAEGLRALGIDVPETETRIERPAGQYMQAANGNIKPTFGNVAHWIRSHIPGVIRLNTMQHYPWILDDAGIFPGPFPRQMTDVDDLRLADHINHDLDGWIGQPFGKDSVRDGVGMAAAEDPWDPLAEMFDSLPPWDGEPRIDTWLLDYGGAAVDESHSEAYLRAVSRKWLIAAVARALTPGCKVDNILVLKGAQGTHREGKSSLFAALAGRIAPGADGLLFGDDMPRVGAGTSDKAAKEWLAGIWIAEVAEMTAISKADAEHVKSFISTQQDRYRVPYTSKAVTVPRSTIFAATTNHHTFLTDTTGNRRFWPVLASGRINVRGLRAERDRIWAEAYAAWAAGEAWWFDYDGSVADAAVYEDVLEAQAAATKDDPFGSKVAAALRRIEDDPADREACPTMLDIYRRAFDAGASVMPQAHRHAMAEAIQAAGWERFPQRHKMAATAYRRGPTAEPYLDPNVGARLGVIQDVKSLPTRNGQGD